MKKLIRFKRQLAVAGLLLLGVGPALAQGGKINIDVPGTIGAAAPCFRDNVALGPFAADGFDATILTSNAFGGAHAAMLLAHA